MFLFFNNDAQNAVSQSLTGFQNILPLAGPLNSSHESPLEAITAIIEENIQIMGGKKGMLHLRCTCTDQVLSAKMGGMIKMAGFWKNNTYF